MSEDVLVKWADLIAFAKAHVGTRSMEDPACCIIDLAAEVRFLRDNLTERELQVRHLVRTHEQTVDSLVAQMDSLQERVAELETDARLGRMVRHMRRRSSLYHEAGIDPILWQYVDFDSGERWEADTPEAALEAARKEELC
jgi:hypothetical protein